MSDKAVARRYARALFELAGERDVMEETLKDLGQVAALLSENKELQTVFQHRLLSPEMKQQIFKEVFSGRISGLVVSFLLLLAAKRRETELAAINSIFQQYADLARNLLQASVETARELSDEEIAAIRQALEVKTGKNIKLEQKLQPNLKGGVRVRVGDTIYDGSVAMRLDLLGKRLRNVELG